MTPHEYLVVGIGSCLVPLVLGLLAGHGTRDRGSRW